MYVSQITEPFTLGAQLHPKHSIKLLHRSPPFLMTPTTRGPRRTYGHVWLGCLCGLCRSLSEFDLSMQFSWYPPYPRLTFRLCDTRRDYGWLQSPFWVAETPMASLQMVDHRFHGRFPRNGSFGTRTNWCVLNKELCTCDCYFLWGCVRSNLSKPCSVPKLLLCGLGRKERKEVSDVSEPGEPEHCRTRRTPEPYQNVMVLLIRLLVLLFFSFKMQHPIIVAQLWREARIRQSEMTSESV